ncbi:hypothetical protein EGI16_01085 [Chryseobacterium sp. G0240]|uniref:hypothetical protein n=1 Tax=Chryseobacterium sp. G0240 TaxID=2487066 RepID=UPI000F454BD5|nr:hypothetical protein [Chryseobacterium sp. G0240]ROI06532.1 hypothetical protein EGI16_01085 [Chryseobacterium sp. G0240]
MIKVFIALLLLAFHFTYPQNVVGNYSSVEPKCKLNLIIDTNNHFIFIVGKHKKIKGIVKLSKQDDVNYLDFGNGINAMFDKDTIFIRNSGNSMNPFVHFKRCDEMYIHLAKRINTNKK